MIQKIETLFAASVTDYPDHVVRVESIADLDELLAAGRLVDELKIRRRRDVSGGADALGSGDPDHEMESDSDGDGVPRIRLKVKHYKVVSSGMAIGGSPAEFGKFIADETEKWGKVITFAGIRAE